MSILEPGLVLTVEAENLNDCDGNLPDPTVGQVFYDDLEFVGEYLSSS